MNKSIALHLLSSPEAVQASLLEWFADIKRDLPWRQSNDIYGIWVSEIMLQQTSVAAVVPYWQNFMAKFPSVNALANAEESEVLVAWSGLGYYSRARNLHRAAKLVSESGAANWPQTRDQWQALPGVGPYAAGAIASIGLGECVPAMDANARRVVQRWAVTDPAGLAVMPITARNRLVDDFGAELVPANEPGTWNEALMELGALICGAKKAQCDVCPMTVHCAAFQGGWSAEVPPPKVKAVSHKVWVGLVAVTWRDHVLLLPPDKDVLIDNVSRRETARHDFSELHPGMWSLPSSVWLKGHEIPAEGLLDWPHRFKFLQALSDNVSPLTEVAVIRHAITKFRLKVSVYELVLDGKQELPASWLATSGQAQIGDDQAGLFFSPQDDSPPISQLTRKALEARSSAFD